MRKSFAIHLPFIIQYGIEDWNDANYAFVALAITTGYLRRLIFDKYVKIHKRYSKKKYW